MVKKDKLNNLILYILSNIHYKDEGIKKLNKILYFVDFYFYKDHERFVSGQTEYAKAGMGPIINNYRDIFENLCTEGLLEKSIKDGAILHKPKKEPDVKVFTSEELDHIHKVLYKYGQLNSKELESISHDQQPWVLTKNVGDIIDPDLALLMDTADDDTEEAEISNKELKDELITLANSA